MGLEETRVPESRSQRDGAPARREQYPDKVRDILQVVTGTGDGWSTTLVGTGEGSTLLALRGSVTVYEGHTYSPTPVLTERGSRRQDLRPSLQPQNTINSLSETYRFERTHTHIDSHTRVYRFWVFTRN